MQLMLRRQCLFFSEPLPFQEKFLDPLTLSRGRRFAITSEKSPEGADFLRLFVFIYQAHFLKFLASEHS